MVEEQKQPGILCISTYEKGQAFLRAAAATGVPVTLLTVEKLRHADWPWESLSQFHCMPDHIQHLDEHLAFVTGLYRYNNYGRVVALDEFDLELAALVREHLRLPGMGQTATRYFRDKLAMREGARRGGVLVPEFSSVANHHALWEFMERTSREGTGGPWLLKPRSSASAIGIKRIERQEDIWPVLEQLGNEASHHLLESFVPGEVFHVDAIWWHGELKFAAAHKYGRPPMQTMHEGGVFTTRTLDRESEEAKELFAIHLKTIAALGKVSGVTHTEFIRAHKDGEFYFLETAARVGGAFIAEVVEFAGGVNPWAEWARIEVAELRGETYVLLPLREEYAGSVICLAKQEEPDISSYDAPEVVLRMHKHHHAGLIVKSPSAERVQKLLEDYSQRFLDEFCTRMDVPDKPTS
jgi:hypothetical protein